MRTQAPRRRLLLLLGLMPPTFRLPLIADPPLHEDILLYLVQLLEF